MNKWVLQAVVFKIEPLRYTPSGIPLLSLVLQHDSEQLEAGMKRKVGCEVNAVILGALTLEQFTKLKIEVGSQIVATGFLAKRSLKSTQMVMHINHIELIS